jgi:hypothetical protein
MLLNSGNLTPVLNFASSTLQISKALFSESSETEAALIPLTAL